MKAESKEYYLVVLSMVLGLIIISSIFPDKTLILHDGNKKDIAIDPLVLIAFGFGFLGLAIPQLMIYVVKGIGFVQHKIGKLITAILLTIVFYIFLTPIAFLAGIFKKKPSLKEDSALIDRNVTYKKEHFEKAF